MKNIINKKTNQMIKESFGCSLENDKQIVFSRMLKQLKRHRKNLNNKIHHRILQKQAAGKN